MQAEVRSLMRDIRYALRMLRRTPGFTAVAILSLAFGIGVNTAVFSLMNALMLRMLPVQHPEQLVELLQKYPGEPRGNGYWSISSYEHFRDHNHVFSAVIAVSPPSGFQIRGEGLGPEIVTGQYVAGNFFGDLGVSPAIGHLIRAQDGDAAVVSWWFWRNRFHLDAGVVGKHIIVQDQPVTIVGVAPRAFFGLLAGSRTDVWLPRNAASKEIPLALLARLKPGVSIQQARAEMAVLYRFTIDERSRNSQDPLTRQLKIELEPAGAGFSLLRDHVAQPLEVLMILVGLLLLIACTNVASLLLARGAARRGEMAIRISLGAGRLRLVRQVLTESLMLSVAGSLIGVWLAYFGAGALVKILASGRRMIGLPQSFEIPFQPDTHVLLFTAGIALLTAILFGLAPAWAAFTSAPAWSLREIGRAGETRFGRFFGKSLIVAQVALSVALLTAAGLFVRNLVNLRYLDLGFERDHVLLATLDPSRSGYNAEQLYHGYQDLLARLGGIPGVRSASISAPTPLSGAGASGFASVEGFAEPPGARRYISLSWIAPGYFATIGTPLLAGRDFNLRDSRTAIVSLAMARYYFAGGNPIGKHLTLQHVTGTPEDKTYEIVGVAGDAKYYEIREPTPRTIYLPVFQDGRVLAQNFLLRTSGDPASIAGDVRRVVRSVLPTTPVAETTRLSDQIDASIVPERLISALSELFGGLGSLLAAVGLYGLLAYTVARRTTEIGVRLALGATPANIIGIVFRDALQMVGLGLFLGVPLAMWAAAIAANLIPNLPPNNAAPIAFGAIGIFTLAMLAAYMPARRAAGVDPMTALRHE
jgi:putative ABC transport system permease protein